MIMLHFKLKKITLTIFLCALTALLSPALTQAEEYETGSIAAKRAAEQREAIAKKAEKRKKEAEAQKAAAVPQEKPAEPQQPTADQTEKAPAQ
jgi:hypothetical protein